MIGRKGLIRRVIANELDADNTVDVITFNHDLLIENALSLLPSKYGAAWCLEHAYGLPSNTTAIASAAPSFARPCPGSPDQHVHIFKMHGSSNWVFRTRSRYPSPDAARGHRKLLLWTNQAIPSHTTLMTGSRKSWHIWPLIVPPIYEKHGFIRDELKRVWDDATAALDRATRVIFWGYSFPRADLHARYFFQGAAHRNPALRRPILINPDPRSADELWAVLEPSSVSHFRDISAFLAESGS